MWLDKLLGKWRPLDNFKAYFPRLGSMCTTAIFSPPSNLTPLLHIAPSSSTNLRGEKRYWCWLTIANFCAMSGVAVLHLPVCPCRSWAHCFQHSHATGCRSSPGNGRTWLEGHWQVFSQWEFSNLMQGLVCLHVRSSAWVSGWHPSQSTLQLNSHPSGPLWFQIFKFHHMAVLAGASAGVYALIAAHLATLLLNWKVTHRHLFVIIFSIQGGWTHLWKQKEERKGSVRFPGSVGQVVMQLSPEHTCPAKWMNVWENSERGRRGHFRSKNFYQNYIWLSKWVSKHANINVSPKIVTCFPKTRGGGGGSRPFRVFMEIHPFCQSQASLIRWIRLISVLAFTLFDISYAIYNHLTEVTISTGWDAGERAHLGSFRLTHFVPILFLWSKENVQVHGSLLWRPGWPPCWYCSPGQPRCRDLGDLGILHQLYTSQISQLTGGSGNLTRRTPPIPS